MKGSAIATPTETGYEIEADGNIACTLEKVEDGWNAHWGKGAWYTISYYHTLRDFLNGEEDMEQEESSIYFGLWGDNKYDNPPLGVDGFYRVHYRRYSAFFIDEDGEPDWETHDWGETVRCECYEVSNRITHFIDEDGERM